LNDDAAIQHPVVAERDTVVVHHQMDNHAVAFGNNTAPKIYRSGLVRRSDLVDLGEQRRLVLLIQRDQLAD
jgi:hypothetical protein